MSKSSSIIGKVKLRDKINAMPESGLTVPRHRVELAESEKPDLVWIAELKVLGDLPWREGEERQVELRIMSDEFRDYIISEQPSLLVKRGAEIIGNLELK